MRRRPTARTKPEVCTSRAPIDDGHQVAPGLSVLPQILKFRDHFCDGIRYIRKSGRYRRRRRWSGGHQAKKSITNLVSGIVNRPHSRRQLLDLHNYVGVILLFFVFGEIWSQSVAQLQSNCYHRQFLDQSWWKSRRKRMIIPRMG